MRRELASAKVIQDSNNTYVYGLGLISSSNSSGTTTFYTSDVLDSTSDLTNSLATKTDGYTYDASGRRRTRPAAR